MGREAQERRKAEHDKDGR